MLYDPYMRAMTVTEVRANFRAVLERVKQGDTVEIIQNGEVVAALLHPSRLSQKPKMEAAEAAERLRRILAEARVQPPEREIGLSLERAEELIAAIRAERGEG